MRLAAVKPNELAVVKDDSYVLIGEPIAAEGVLPRGATMVDLMTQFDRVQGVLGKAIARGKTVKADPKLLKAPVEKPSKVWAAAGNYKRGSSDIGESRGRGAAEPVPPEHLLEAIFLKPPSSVIGPEQAIIIPKNAETIFPELELGVVIGKEVHDLPKSRALEAVFGYTIILDVTARGYGSGQNLIGSRCVRKGFNTFCPVGPWIATKDEIPNPQSLAMRLWVNGQLRQSARTDAMVNDVARLVSFLSEVGTLYPGDLISTGNPDAPEFQEQLKPGDVLKVEIEGIGTMSLTVESAR
ncbi:MAG TPA: fumarylacetoacetate hydrolase family protein [Candidatus Binatia bacterium]